MSGQYTPEEQAAAWAAVSHQPSTLSLQSQISAHAQYYAQQGYTPDQIAAASQSYYDPSASASAYASSSSNGYNNAGSVFAGTPGAYQTISINPSTSSSLAAAGPGPSGTATPPTGPGGKVLNRQVFDTDIINQSSIYQPGAPQELVKAGKARPPPGKRDTVIRKGNGRTWEDPSLLDWDPKWFRLFVGDVSNDVNERTLNEAFGRYKSYCKCKVVKDRLSEKSKYGFIAFKDPEDMLKAWKEMDGKYVGNRPIRLSKIKDDQYGSIATTSVSGRKLDKLRRNHGKPLDGRPTPW